MKRLIICCDGTWQQLTNPFPSNIVKLAQAVKPIASERREQGGQGEQTPSMNPGASNEDVLNLGVNTLGSIISASGLPLSGASDDVAGEKRAGGAGGAGEESVESNSLDVPLSPPASPASPASPAFFGDGVTQIVFYDEGIGTESKATRLLGGVTGLGIDRNIQDAYRFLCLNYVSGDEIYLFGFSRGAYTVRSLAGMIYCSGLLDRPHITRAPEAYELYRNRDIKPRDEVAVDYRQKYGDRVPITLLSCFDTVGALGIPGLPAFKQFHQQLNKRYRFHDTTLNKSIQNALHAVAIDEIREVFDVTPMKKHPDAESQKVIQVWFPGEHGCVGGGTEEHSGLSDAVLQWMMDSIRDLGLGLEFDPSAIPTGINPNYEIDFKNDLGFFKLAGIKLRDVGDTIEDLHESVIKRLQSREDYRPKNLEQLLAKFESVVKTASGSQT